MKAREPNHKSKHSSKNISTDSVTVEVPGSTANLGPGFDTLALALTIYARLTFTLLPENEKNAPFVAASGMDQSSLETAIPRFIFKVLQERIKMQPQIIKRLHLDVDSQIPIGRGFGSSAAMVMATLYASERLCKRVPDRQSLLSLGAAIEGHADNAAASLLGGLVVTSIADDRRTVLAKRLEWPEDWHLILVVPPRQLTTNKARSVLPKTVPYEDAVYNVQRTALLLAAIQNQDEELAREALHDRLHEKYRAELIPELEALKKEFRDSAAIGCVLSGAGSSVLMPVHEGKKKDLLKQITNWLKQQGMDSHILDLKVDEKGLKELNV
ncbi:MAG: homoserine kinase [Candidatus Melainabacteria bacterium]|nr:MAG: homoserine kinase [Candidatus Melainabacteria bacterium]